MPVDVHECESLICLILLFDSLSIQSASLFDLSGWLAGWLTLLLGVSKCV